MKYTICPTGKRSFSGINVEHKEEIIFFKGTQKVSNGNADEELFEFINAYFEVVTEEQCDRHWELLKQAKRILEPGYFNEESEDILELRNNNLNYNFLNAKLTPIINACYENIKPGDISYTAEVTNYIKPPSDLNYITTQGDYPEETTINDNKYKELAKTAFITQLVYPVFNQLLDHITMVTGKDFKDAVVGELVCKVPAIVNSVGYDVLYTYLKASCMRQEPKRNSTIIGSDAKYIDHVTYKGLLSKLCLTFIPSHAEKKNLTNELNSLVAGEIRGDSNAKFKSFGDPKPTGEDLSIQEAYSLSQDKNGSDELAQALYFSFGLTKEVSPGVHQKVESGFFKYQCLGLDIKNQAMAEKIYNSLPKNVNFILTNAQVKILQLTFPDDINSQLYDALDYDQQMAAIALAQTKLFELGFEHLACCVYSIKNPEIPTMLIDDTYKLNTRERELLVDLCSEYVGQQTGSTDNEAVRATTDFLEELASSGWESNIEIGLLGNPKFVSLMSPNHLYPLEVNSNIKKEFLELITLRNAIIEE